VYPVGFLYRHCIELNMKAAIVRSSWFRDLNPKRKGKKFRTHSLAKLCGMLEPILSEFTTDGIKPFEEQLLELERLDESSQFKSTGYSTYFTPCTSGSNGAYSCSATQYNQAAGIGAPKGWALANAL
jgi:hypothetical protein